MGYALAENFSIVPPTHMGAHIMNIQDTDVSTSDEDYLFERVFIETALEIAQKELGMKKSVFARKVFTNRAAPERTLYAVLGVARNNKAQRITLSEAYRMSQTVHREFPMLALLAQARMEESLKAKK